MSWSPRPSGLLEACGATIDDVDLYVPHQANKRIIDHAAEHLGMPPEKVLVNIDRYGNTSSASIPLGLAEAVEDGRIKPGDARAHERRRRRPDVGLGVLDLVDGNGGREGRFLLSGPGLPGRGHGPRDGRRLPRGAGGLRGRSDAVGFDLARICFEGPIEELTRTEIQQPALVTTSLACLRAVETRGISADVVVGHSVGEYSALEQPELFPTVRLSALVRERGEATAAAAAEHPGAMAAIIGLEDSVVEELCGSIENVWPANYNCPGQLVVSGERGAVDRLLEEAAARGARKTVKLRVGGAFHSPLVASAAERLRPAVEAVSWKEPVSAVHVDGDRADRIGRPARRAPRPAADRSSPVHAGCSDARAGGRRHVRRDRPGSGV